MKTINVKMPLGEEVRKNLRVGDHVRISGAIYTARDAAHQRMIKNLDCGIPLPFDPNDQLIYYVGPCPKKPGQIIGSAGPTTSGRMDVFTPRLLEKGLGAMMGKGNRSQAVVAAMIDHKALYFGCVGGAGALLQNCIKAVEMIAYEDLGTEAIRRFIVEDFPAIVVIDSEGNNLYEIERKKYQRSIK